MRAPILVRYVIGRETWLYGFGVRAVSYLLVIHFERLADVDTTKCILGLIFLPGTLLRYIYMILSAVILL